MQQIRKAMIWVLVSLQIVSVSACTSTHATVVPASGLTPAALLESVKVGDRVEIFQGDGSSLKMKVTAISESLLTGVDSKKKVYEIPISSIEGLTTKRISAGKTTAAVGAVGVSLWIILGILLSSMAFMV